jgi:hypothetical protein
MNKFGIKYAITFAGYIYVDAVSQADVFKTFDELDHKRLLDNRTKIVEVEIYGIDQYYS